MSETIPVSRRTEGIAYWGMSSTLAAAVAPAVGLWIFHQAGWLAVCVGMACLSGLMAFLASRLPGGSTRTAPALPGWREAFPWRVMAVTSAFLTVSFGYGGITSYVALLSMERKILPPSLFFTVFAISVLVFRVFLARAGDRAGPKALLLPSLAVIPPALLVLALAETRSMLIVAALLMGAGFGGAYPAFTSFLLGRTPDERRAATFGSILWAFDSGMALGSFTTGFLAERYDFRVAFLAAAAISLLAVPAFLVSVRFLPPPQPAGAAGAT
jgi:MFS family permease